MALNNVMGVESLQRCKQSWMGCIVGVYMVSIYDFFPNRITKKIHERYQISMNDKILVCIGYEKMCMS
jgi:hypothetical protein